MMDGSRIKFVGPCVTQAESRLSPSVFHHVIMASLFTTSAPQKFVLSTRHRGELVTPGLPPRAIRLWVEVARAMDV